MTDWNDYESIARSLLIAQPEVNPAGLSNEALRVLVCEAGLVDTPVPPRVECLSAIRAKWIMLSGGGQSGIREERPACLDA